MPDKSRFRAGRGQAGHLQLREPRRPSLALLVDLVGLLPRELLFSRAPRLDPAQRLTCAANLGLVRRLEGIQLLPLTQGRTDACVGWRVERLPE